jgi:DNA-binding phage protein
MKPYVSGEGTIQRLQNEMRKTLKRPKDGAAYLSAALRDDDPMVWGKALENLLDAHGGISKVSKGAKVSLKKVRHLLGREACYEMKKWEKIFKAFGFQMIVMPKEAKRKK